MKLQYYAVQKTNAILIVVFFLLLLLIGCQPPSGGGGGITIPQSDGSAPELSLGAGQQGGQNVTVSAGGSPQNLQLISKSGSLNLLATANDPESGIQALEIWVNKVTTSCDLVNNICTQSGPGLLSSPMFESSSPQKQPGDTTAAGSILAQALDLSQQIPQGSVAAGHSRTVTLTIYAVAVNHLGGRTQTPEIKAVWSEP
jgi:hypothetical protein